MSYVPGFKYDLFVSYAHFDNEVDTQDVRWVSRFQADLKNALRQRLGEEAEVFFDTRNLEAHNHVDTLIENVQQSAVFLPIFSPSYAAREFTIRELQAFCERGPADNRIVTVELLPVDEERHHALLQGRKRTPFWWKDNAEHDIPLRLTPKFNPQMYHERLQILAHQLKKLLSDLRTGGTPQPGAGQSVVAVPAAVTPAPPPAVASPPAQKAVLLAQTTDDLYDERERVRAYLEQFAIKVLPEADYPQGGTDFAAAFDADLARSELFVQLLGTFPSRRPPDLTQTYSQYQYESAKGAGRKILQWRRPDLDLAAVTHRDKPLLEGPDVLAIGLEEFKSGILRHCTEQPKAETLPPGDCHFFINADRSDQELADQLLKLFENNKNLTAARPLFEGTASEVMEDLEANLMNCGALLLLYGKAPPAWVRAQLLRFSKLEKRRDEPLLLRKIVLGPPIPKADIAWSGGFEKLDCQQGDILQQIQTIIDGTRS